MRLNLVPVTDTRTIEMRELLTQLQTIAEDYYQDAPGSLDDQFINYLAWFGMWLTRAEQA